MHGMVASAAPPDRQSALDRFATSYKSETVRVRPTHQPEQEPRGQGGERICGSARRIGAGGQGPQDQRDHVPVQRGDRRRVDGARLQPGGHARRDRRVRRFRRTGDHDRRVHPDAVHRRGVLLPEPRRPDCGTTFTWVTRAIGPRAGWIGGWAIIVTDIIVMPNLAGIAGVYSFQLFGEHQPDDVRGHARRRRVDRRHDGHLLDRHRAVGPHTQQSWEATGAILTLI